MNNSENFSNEKISEKETKNNGSVVPFLYDIAETIVISTAVVILIFTFIVRITVVDGPSMNNTLTHGDILIASDLMYEPKYGDIVVLQNVNSLYSQPIVKRVIATEGQTVDIDFETWTVTVDGTVLDEEGYRYLADDAVVTSNIEFPVTVPDGCVFVMGDNRNHSADSRDYRIGMIDTRCIFGRVISRLMPFSEFTIFERF